MTSEPTSAAAVSVEILREWRGRIALPLTGGRMRPAHEPPRVIRDPRGYDDFLALIPAKRVQMKQPAPASEDPLLKRPPVDFERELLIVAFRVDSMYVHPEITNLKLANDTLMGQVDYPPLGASRMAAARVDVGTYHAVVVRRRAGRVQISDVRAESR